MKLQILELAKQSNMSNVEIGKKVGRPESTVRKILANRVKITAMGRSCTQAMAMRIARGRYSTYLQSSIRILVITYQKSLSVDLYSIILNKTLPSNLRYSCPVSTF